MAMLSTNLRSVFVNILRRSHTDQSVKVTASPVEDAEAAFIASLANMSPAEHDAAFKRRAWYQALAERQGIAEVEWQAERAQRYHA